MRTRPSLITLLVAFFLTAPYTGSVLADESLPANGEVARLVGLVSDPDTDWEVRQTAEQSLAKLPARVVLPVLVAHMPDQPPGVFYPPADSPAADKDAPPAWQAFYAARRVWKAQTGGAGRPSAELADLLPDLLRVARTSEARAAVAARLATAWSDRAEEPLARLFRDSAETSAVRARAAEALLANRPAPYRAEIAGVADAAPWSSDLKQALFLALTAPVAGAGQVKAEAFTVTLGFGLMEHHARENDIEAAYACARRLAAYLDQRFRPDPSGGPYGPDPDADPRFRRETLDNARRWWGDHGPAIEREAAKSKPGPA
jgi:hypothetical protein